MVTGCSLRMEADAFSEGKIWSPAESFSDRERRNYQRQLLEEDLWVEREIKLQERQRRRQELQAQRKAQRDKAPLKPTKFGRCPTCKRALKPKVWMSGSARQSLFAALVLVAKAPRKTAGLLVLCAGTRRAAGTLSSSCPERVLQSQNEIGKRGTLRGSQGHKKNILAGSRFFARYADIACAPRVFLRMYMSEPSQGSLCSDLNASFAARPL